MASDWPATQFMEANSEPKGGARKETAMYCKINPVGPAASPATPNTDSTRPRLQPGTRVNRVCEPAARTKAGSSG
jgi:hypothetical protein